MTWTRSLRFEIETGSTPTTPRYRVASTTYSTSKRYSDHERLVESGQRRPAKCDRHRHSCVCSVDRPRVLVQRQPESCHSYSGIHLCSHTLTKDARTCACVGSCVEQCMLQITAFRHA